MHTVQALKSTAHKYNSTTDKLSVVGLRCMFTPRDSWRLAINLCRVSDNHTVLLLALQCLLSYLSRPQTRKTLTPLGHHQFAFKGSPPPPMPSKLKCVCVGGGGGL